MTDIASKNGTASNGGMHENMVLSHLTMRRALGIMGLLLPILLAVLSGPFEDDGMRPTISDYYHSQHPILRGLFVGIIFATGVFLICYKGYARKGGERLEDNAITTVAGSFALGIALFPANRLCTWLRLREFATRC